MALTPGANTGPVGALSTLDGLFKRVYADAIVDLVPEGLRLLKAIPFQESKKLGESYNQPVALG